MTKEEYFSQLSTWSRGDLMGALRNVWPGIITTKKKNQRIKELLWEDYVERSAKQQNGAGK